MARTTRFVVRFLGRIGKDPADLGEIFSGLHRRFFDRTVHRGHPVTHKKRIVRITLSEVATALNLAARTKWHIAETGLLPPLLLLSDEVRLPDPSRALAALPAGSGFIFRHYDDPHREDMAVTLLDIARARGIFFLVASDPDLAVALGADGCHMPEHRLEDLALCTGHFSFNTVAAHSGPALAAAARRGASAALLSPIFTTQSHPGARPLGAHKAADLAAGAPLPVYALGGLNSRTAPELAGSAFAGLAAIEGLVPEDP